MAMLKFYSGIIAFIILAPYATSTGDIVYLADNITSLDFPITPNGSQEVQENLDSSIISLPPTLYLPL